MKYLDDDTDNEKGIEIFKYAEELEDGMKKSCSKVKLLGKPDGDGAAWYYEMGDDLCGFVSLDRNSNSIQIATVLITISLGEISNWGKEDLLNILDKNGELFRAAFTVVEIEGSWILFLQYKVIAESFKPEEFEKCIDYLQLQAAEHASGLGGRFRGAGSALRENSWVEKGQQKKIWGWPVECTLAGRMMCKEVRMCREIFSQKK